MRTLVLRRPPGRQPRWDGLPALLGDFPSEAALDRAADLMKKRGDTQRLPPYCRRAGVVVNVRLGKGEVVVSDTVSRERLTDEGGSWLACYRWVVFQSGRRLMLRWVEKAD